MGKKEYVYGNKRWEYRIEGLVALKLREGQLNDLAKEGWELYIIGEGGVGYFRRQL
jgi:hypothetical protein